MSLDRQIVNLNDYELVDAPDAFVEAISALAARTEAEGHPGVLRYSFYVNRAEKTGGAAIVYADAKAWIAHHQIAYQWEEMPALQATVRLKQLTLLGPLDEELEDWLSGAGIDFVHYDTLAAGFER